MGRTRQGFDWLGIAFTDKGPVGIALRAQQNYAQRRSDLAARCRRARFTPTETAQGLQNYDTQWQRWAQGQLNAARLTKSDGLFDFGALHGVVDIDAAPDRNHEGGRTTDDSPLR
ncbi:MAG: hypothetical protein RR818_09635 [Citrobacter sp.]